MALDDNLDRLGPIGSALIALLNAEAAFMIYSLKWVNPQEANLRRSLEW